MCHPPGVLHLRPATLDDLAELLPRTRALNAHEGIALEPAALEGALARLLRDPSLGGAWLVEQGGAAIGYAIVTFGYDLEFGGRDAYLTELWIDPPARGHGAGGAALALLDPELRARGIEALHLQVRPDNPARRLYQRSGFVASPRIVMTRRL
ncbi:MAG: GNAT family N-acetyltransferase [Deltaproteobacteria bacterium]|nr:MAG: GNAT family N-acetyltransferase [Deltaproteobacteria bacterium]